MSELPNFFLPKILDSSISWGPEENTKETIDEIPYTPFSKFDKIGKAADWAQSEPSKQIELKGRQKGKQNRDQAYQTYGSNQTSAFAIQETNRDNEFFLVENRASTTKKVLFKTRGSDQQKNGRAFGDSKRQGMQRLGGSGSAYKSAQRQTQKRHTFRRAYNWNDYKKMQKSRASGIEIGKDWTLLEEIDFARMSKLRFKEPGSVNYGLYGKLSQYNFEMDKIDSRNQKRLNKDIAVRFNVTAIEDPVMTKISEENKAKIFITDVVLSTLMTSTRSFYPWEIFVTRVGDKVFFDKRDNGPTDTLTVNENAYDRPNEYADKNNSINTASSLASEAAEINNRVLLQCVNPKITIDAPNSNPFNPEDEETGVDDIKEINDDGCYIYKLYDLNLKTSDNDGNESQSEDDSEAEKESRKAVSTKNSEDSGCIMAVRSQIDATANNSFDEPMLIRALNQFDVKAQGAGGAIDWTTKFSSQRGAILATELKNNATKLGKWAFQALLAGISTIKLAFVTRSTPRNNEEFNVIGILTFKPEDLLSKMGYEPTLAWGIVKVLVDMSLKLDEGRYLIVRDPSKPVLKLYNTPNLSINNLETEQTN
ncbi:hypothetical protein BB560_000221 [Smittium megazygosporum]|uniref:EIF3d n=1 Tax=Smittium megazygosporum TaxID=133381 RepID=A0A2T9ZKY2_9FUNG|nr:hypothetical protein BB560_000221 [Smittium megazygosporum]